MLSYALCAALRDAGFKQHCDSTYLWVDEDGKVA